MSKFCSDHSWIYDEDKCYKCELDFLRMEIDRLNKENEELNTKLLEALNVAVKINLDKDDFKQIEDEIKNPTAPNKYLKNTAKRLKNG